jgi:8-amino-7-oxononanoate synthase
MRAPLYERIVLSLENRRSQGLLRAIPESVPPSHGRAIDLSTNSYLAIHLSKDVAAAAQELCGDALHGNLASRLVAETSPLTAALEAELSAWKSTEAALLFNSGYAANVGILQAIATRDSEIFCDRLNHASIIDGIQLSGARLNRYRHCDMADLAARLSASKAAEKIIVTDTVFSMDGDCAPLADICELGRAHSCFIMVDEAHAAGVLGPGGGGLVEALGLADAVDVRIGTLSKAIAGVGGFFAGSKLLRDYFVNSVRSLIYSTGLPHAVIAFDLAAVRHIRAHPGLGHDLLRAAQSFRERLREAGFDTLTSTTQIVPCIVGDAATALDLQVFLRDRGIIAPAIRPPTVPQGSARIRFSVHLGFTKNDDEQVLAALREWKERNG